MIAIVVTLSGLNKSTRRLRIIVKSTKKSRTVSYAKNILRILIDKLTTVNVGPLDPTLRVSVHYCTLTDPIVFSTSVAVAVTVVTS